MTTKLQTYPQYKPSGLSAEASAKAGIDWLGDIPEGWEGKKLKFVANIHASNVDKQSYKSEQEVLLCNYIDVYKNEFINNALPFMTATASTQQIKKFGLRIGDVLITKDSETASDIGVPAYVRERLKNLVCGYHFLDAETAKIDKAAALIESQIEKLKEYRSSLIYHAVTGKIKI